jgi:hypothetical protein
VSLQIVSLGIVGLKVVGSVVKELPVVHLQTGLDRLPAQKSIALVAVAEVG